MSIDKHMKIQVVFGRYVTKVLSPEPIEVEIVDVDPDGFLNTRSATVEVTNMRVEAAGRYPAAPEWMLRRPE